jgi:hypothetical protein
VAGELLGGEHVFAIRFRVGLAASRFVEGVHGQRAVDLHRLGAVGAGEN